MSKVADQENDKEKVNKVKSVLVSQPKPADDSPYVKLAEKYKIKVDFRPFIHIESVPVREFRQQKVYVKDYSSVIFTSRNAIDNYFRTCKELKFEPPADTKYFCISDQTAYYLQKYIIVRKRKVYTGSRTAEDLIEILKKHKTESFLYPCSDIRKDVIPNFLEENGYKHAVIVLYRTVASDLSDLENVNYDIIAFFSPSGLSSLFKNFPDFKQNETRIAAFGATTAQAVRDQGLLLDIEAPMPNAPSMAGALEDYIKRVNKLKN